MNHLRLAIRMLARNPRSTVLIAGLLALGIGASTVIFSLFDAVLLRRLPVSRPEELVRMAQTMPRFPSRSSFPYPYYEALKDHAQSVTAFGEAGEYQHFGMTEPTPAEQITVRGVTPDFFAVLGARPLHGRVLKADDADRRSGLAPAVLSYGFWQRRFHGDPQVVMQGQTIVVNKQRFSIVGVMPRDFNGLSVDTAPDLRIPLTAYSQMANLPLEQMYFEVAGRLKPNVARAQAEMECAAIWRQTMKEYWQNVEKAPARVIAVLLRRGMILEPLERGTSILRERFGDVFKLLMACVSLLLLIVCTNVAGLLLAGAVARRQEMAVRLAIGASRFRLVQQTIVENLILTGLGAAGGLALATAGIPLALRLLPPLRDRGGLPTPLAVDLGGNMGIEPRVLLFALAVSLATMLVFSVSPAIAIAQSSLDGVLRSVRASGGVRGRQILITLQIAVCTFLLVAASLFVRTLQRLGEVAPGFAQDRIATFTYDLNGYKNPALFIKDLTARVGDIPGVVSVSASNSGLMLGHGLSSNVAAAGERITRGDLMNVNWNPVTLHYFDTMGIRLLAGRDLTTTDAAERTPGAATKPLQHAVVSEMFAQRFFPRMDPLGKRFGSGLEGTVAPGEYEIVGVVSDAKFRSLREPITPMIYTLETTFDSFVLNVRTRIRPEAMIEPVRRASAELAPDRPFIEARTLAAQVEEITAPERISAVVASLFGAIAALLVGVGTYGLLVYALMQRRREIGIRMALGAQPQHVAKLIGGQTVVMAAGGIVVGLGAALLAGRAVGALLYGISPQDSASLLAAVFLVLLTAALATLFPVMSAIETEPADALRLEN
jgi:predicted permease